MTKYRTIVRIKRWARTWLPKWTVYILRKYRKIFWIPRVFNHKQAQIYEFRSAYNWTHDNLKWFYGEFLLSKQKGDFWSGPYDANGHNVISDFFHNNESEWRSFANTIHNKTCLEIGSGPAGYLLLWHWARKRIIIDPLILQYKKLASEFGADKLFSSNLVLHEKPAEIFIDELDKSIDGCIVCRNTLDHCENPYLVLRNIARYAKPGCILLLWTDLYHLWGHDEKHRDITKDKKNFQNFLENIGFKIEYQLPDLRGDYRTINYGCVATKIS
ncbi:MAG: hypothetical protein WBC21_03235 [Minisyncoccales bacterium]